MDEGWECTSITLEIGSFRIRLEFDNFDISRNVVMTSVPLAPPFVTTLQVNLPRLDEQEWRDFFRTHPEMHSIGCSEVVVGPMLKSLWNVLPPVQGGVQDISCPSLETIYLRVEYKKPQRLASLLNCLWDRKGTGFKLRHLSIDDGAHWEVYKIAEEFHPLVEVLDVKLPSLERQRVSHVSTHEADVR